jgi:Protein of unknown function, DUF481
VRRQLSLLLLSFFALAPVAFPQAPDAATAKPAAAPPTDVLIFANGDRLTGKLESVTDGNVVFNSDMAGTLTISIDKIKELKSGAEFALLRKGDLPGKTHAPEGSVVVAEGKLTLTPVANEPPAVVPAADVNYLIDRASYDKQMSHHAGFGTGWAGKITGGANIERSTTSGTTFYAGLALVRSIPTVPWMLPRNRTIIDVNESYGKLSTPAIPPTSPPTPDSVVKTNIFHADAERDEYFNPRLYALANTSFDHNFGQGLDLQQVYGGGVGYTAIKDANQELDLKAEVHYMKQSYISTTVDGVDTTTPSKNLIGSTFFEGYSRNLPHKMLFTESLDYLPAWNDSKAYSANLNAALILPVFKRFAASLAVADNYLNDPAEFYKKNSFQFIAGITYVLP